LLRLRSADAAMDMMRRMPLRSTDTAFNTLLQLLPDRSLDLLSHIDLPL
jgi:capping protein (actin filament) muscle Z-line, beta